MSKTNFIKGTLLLSVSGLITRLIGFFYRIFLSHTIGAEGIGIFQLVLPIQTLLLSISAAGIQMAVSRLCSSQLALKKKQNAWNYFFIGTSLSLFLTSIFALFLYSHNAILASRLLREPRTAGLLKIIAFSLPLGALHNCIAGYYFARKDTRLPSFLQLAEQIAKFSVTYALFQIYVSEGKSVSAGIAAAGALGGEIVSAFLGSLVLAFYFSSENLKMCSSRHFLQDTKSLLAMAVPLSLNRILLTFLSSVEVILIPQQLRKCGLGSAEALQVYGIFTGMALPLILFPATITGAVSAMLLPSVAELQTLGYYKRIRYVAARICFFTFLLGMFCCIGFVVSGHYIGTVLFHNIDAGNYIRSMAFLCPFLYLHTTIASILHGLGRSKTCLLHNLAGACIRLLFVCFSIPRLGIRGYLYGMLVCELIETIFHLFDLQTYLGVKIG